MFVALTRFGTMAGACGRCCQMEGGEVEVKQTAKTRVTPGFQGPLDKALPNLLDASPKPTAVEDAMVKLVEEPAAENRKQHKILSAQAIGPAAESLRQTTSTSPVTFKTTVQKGERKLGIDINWHDQATLLVTKINEGPIWDHNSAHQANRLLPGDRIIELNGIRDNTQKMLASCKDAAELQITVTTAPEHTTNFEPSGCEQLGITAEQCDMVSLVVTKVEEGIVARQGSEASDLALRVGDRIVGINHAKLHAGSLLQELLTASSWKITWRRPEFKAA